MRPGEAVELAIERPAVGGRMIARAGGRIALVAGAIPGERVTARVERVAKGVVYATTLGIEDPSPDRRASAADPACGGCSYAHISYPRQLAIKADVVADAFARIARLPLPGAVAIAASPEDGYRMRARLHVRGHHVGFFREGTHDLCDARATRQLLPDTCDALDRLAAGLRSLGVSSVRAIELAENGDASHRAVHLDLPYGPDERLVAGLARTEGFTGFGPAATVTDSVRYGGAEMTLQRHVLAFFQGNRYLLGDLVRHVIEQVPSGGELLDLYAGSGLFAVAAASARGAQVRAVEGDRTAAADLVANAVPHPGIATFHDSVEAFLAHAGKWPGTVIVDPPRTGLSPEARGPIAGLGAARIVYVSCDVATLARDARVLVDGGYRISRADGFDLFPNTPHVETVVVFERGRDSGRSPD
jgi:23S rRNA (uracil1939-C5)-methyltransferase